MRTALVTAVVLLAVAGCGDGRAEVSGTVRMDGEPLKEGEIIFEATDNATAAAAGKITDGRYSVRVGPGPKRVKILASRPTSKVDPVMGATAQEWALGPEYNSKTTLRINVKPGRQTGVDFTVKSLPRAKGSVG